MPRLRPPRDPVTVWLDGEPVLAERGEPVAVALVASGRLALARSPKFHRPRGPSCLRGGCDGCLARVDGVPGSMTCRVPAEDGMRVETQNVVGSRDTDLLRMADWFFPDGMNHHELLAGVPGVQRMMQAFARRVAGVGELPAQPAPARAARRREADALVVGAGPAGMAVALELAMRGRRVEVLDEDLAWGGCVRAMVGGGEREWEPLVRAFGEAAASSYVTVQLGAIVAGVYGDDVLVARADGAEVFTARTLVLAPGAHDGALAFEGNDIPGVMSARAACLLLAHSVAIGKRAVVVQAEGGGPFGELYARAVPGTEVVRGNPLRVRGSARVKELTIATDDGERRLGCDALLLDLPRAPAYELCVQAGAEVERERRGFVVKCEAGGRIRGGVFAAGEAVGTALTFEAVTREAETLAAEADRAALDPRRRQDAKD